MKFRDIAYWTLIVVVILFCIFLAFYLISTGKKCLANPLEYYQTVMNNSGATCTCIKDGAFTFIK